MGGCRCTFKNCTLRTDGVTHMFHYPVFDKVRCHQWLTNAQKLEFLNLKVSQLKNRVVCQHHFRDDNFMNFLKDKLTFDAVPTLDGPYCDSSQLTDKKTRQEDSKLYSISLDDIENEYLTLNDKKANFSVKYGDFLTNCDLMDLDSMNLTSDNTQIITKNKNVEESSNIILNNNIDQPKITTVSSVLNKNLDVLEPNENTVYTITLSEKPVKFTEVQSNLINSNLNVTPPAIQTQNQGKNIKILGHRPKEQLKKNNNRSLLKEKKKITIIDEQKISDAVPVSFPIALEPVSPSSIITLLRKRKTPNINISDNNKQNQSVAKPVAIEQIGSNTIIEQAVSLQNNVDNLHVDNKHLDQVENQHNESSTYSTMQVSNANVNINRPCPQQVQIKDTKKSIVKKVSNTILKTKIAPERMAAIEEKRKFNMKLRDIIASCLDKLDDEEAKHDSSKLKSKIEKNITQKVSSYLSKEPELPHVNDYTVAYLEARMKKMEDILLNKIDQNTKRITDLTQILSPNKKVAHTQTVLNEEVQKKHLYQEISKYLSPEANSLLYEELFINKYAHKITRRSPTKKRKYR